MSPSTRKIISCDWGSTNVRFRLLDLETGQVLRSTEGSRGVLEIVKSANGGEAAPLFESVVRESLAPWIEPDLAQAMVVSGMPSARGAWCELPYARVPFPLNGQSVVTQELPALALGPTTPALPVLLVSGLAAPGAVMRGEETQLIGLHSLGLISDGDCVVLPGTHSKHVAIKGNAVQGFRSFMTGELFHLLRSHSSLAPAMTAPPEPSNDAFERGVRSAAAGQWAESLFPVRGHHLLGTAAASEGSSFLSGLLIGSELRTLDPDLHVVIAAGAGLIPPYRRAAELLGIDQVHFLSDEQLTQGFLQGHAALWKAQCQRSA